MPGHPEDFLPGPLEQGVVDRDRECRIRWEEPVLQQHVELILPVGLVDQVVAGVVE
jgi:hypothetical protein